MSFSSRADVLAPAALVVLWSSGFVGAELGTREAPASTLLAWRYLVAATLLIAWCVWRRERVTRPAVARQVVLGLLVQAGYLGLVVTGVGLGVTAGTSSLIASLQPLAVAALAALVLGERPRPGQLVGLATGLCGVALVVGGDLARDGAAWWVYLLPAGGMLALSGGTVLQQRWQPEESVVVSLTVQTATAAAVFWVVAGLQGTASAPAGPGFWWAIAWVVVLSSFGGYGSYLYVARRDGATRASTWLYLTPPATMVWAGWMFGDPVGVLGLVGLAVCAAGVTLALRPVRPAGAASPGARCRRSRRRSQTLGWSRTPTTRRGRWPRAARCRSRARGG
jgi:drug/metabolite transporter (DMT)-like permease